MSKISIIHLSTAHSRSDVRIFLKEAQTLASKIKQSIAFFVADGLGDEQKPSGEVSIHDMGKVSGGRLSYILKGNWRSFWACLKFKPKIVHFHDPELIPVGILLRLFGYIVIYDVHESLSQLAYSRDWVPKPTKLLLSLFLNWIESIGCWFFTAIVAATPKIANEFPKKKTILVQNFPWLTEMLRPNPIPYMKRPKDIAYIGGLSNIRGGLEMVQSLGLLEDRTNIKLNIAGTISPVEFDQKLRGLKSWDRVNFLGMLNREELLSLFDQVRAGVVTFLPLPNHIEAQPNKMFEYMAAGLPVIGSNFPLWKEIIEGNQCGMVVDPESPEDIAKAISWLIDNPSEAEAMGRRGSEAVESKYNWESESVKLVNLYQKLLSKIF